MRESSLCIMFIGDIAVPANEQHLDHLSVELAG
jgi:hypothetical protein